MKSIFVNRDSQIRSGWKIALTFICSFITISIIGAVIVLVYTVMKLSSSRVSANDISGLTSSITAEISNINSPLGFISNLVQCFLMIFFVVLFWKVFDKKPIREIGMINIKKGHRDLLKGLLMGAISLLIVFVILLASGNVILINPLSRPNFSFPLLISLIGFIFVGINEEMFARGYCLTVLKQTKNVYVVVIVSSIIFALLHSSNPGMSIFSYINLFLFGLLTAYMAIKSGNLWLSIGYHITWNYFEGNVCGFLVSGLTTSSLYGLKVPHYNIINGGSFGPEGGIVVTFIILVGFLYLWKFYKPTYHAAQKDTNITLS